MMLRRLGGTLLLLAVSCLLAQGDELRLEDGRKLQGKLICQMHGLVYFRLPDEFVFFPVTDVKEIVPSKTKREEYRDRAAKLGFVDAKGHLELARWCIEWDLRKAARKELRVVLEIDPKSADAKALLAKLDKPLGPILLPEAPLVPIKIFNHHIKGTGIVFLVDQSGSMRERWASIRQRLVIDLLQLTPRHRFNVIMFSGSPRTLFEKLQPGTQKWIMKAQAWLSKQKTRGVTHLRKAFELAINTKGCDRIVLMTDLEAEGGEVDPISSYIRKRLTSKEFAKKNPPIDVISMADGHGDNTKLKNLIALARKQPDFSAKPVDD